MKKILITLLLLLSFPMFVEAKGSISVSKTNVKITVGDKTNVKITANNAAGRIDISSSNGSVATVSKSSVFLDNDSVTIDINGVSVGTAQIKIVTTDVGTYDNEVINKTFIINVTVAEKVIDNRSKNTNLKSMTVEGFDIKQVDNSTYSLSVGNSVSSIKVSAEAEDEKATVSGIGTKNLVVGENYFEISVRAENGTIKKYTLKVTRRDDNFYLNDIDEFIKSDNTNLLIVDNDILTDDAINKLKTVDKDITFTKNDESGKPIYEFKINSKSLINAFSTDVTVVNKVFVENKKNGLEGISILVNSNIPKNSTLTIDVSKSFVDNSELNVYKYKGQEVKLLNNIKVANGKITIELDDGEEYFITKDTFKNTKSNSSIIPYIVIFSIALITVTTLFTIKFNKLKKQLKDQVIN